eukprot:86544_1
MACNLRTQYPHYHGFRASVGWLSKLMARIETKAKRVNTDRSVMWEEYVDKAMPWLGEQRVWLSEAGYVSNESGLMWDYVSNADEIGVDFALSNLKQLTTKTSDVVVMVQEECTFDLTKRFCTIIPVIQRHIIQ